MKPINRRERPAGTVDLQPQRAAGSREQVVAVDAQLLGLSRLEVANETERGAVHAVHYRGLRNRLDQLDPETATRRRPGHHRAKQLTRPARLSAQLECGSDAR